MFWEKYGKILKPLIVVGIVLFILFAIAGSVYGFANSLNKTAVDKEIDLGNQYAKCQTDLSNFEAKVLDQLGVANTASQQLRNIVKSAYQGANGVNGSDLKNSNNQFYTQISRQLPDLKALDIYNKISDTISAGRDQYRDDVVQLQSMLGDYKKFLHDDLFRSMVLAGHFPSENLESRIGKKITGTGSDALKNMGDIIETEQTNQEYNSGTLQPIVPNP